MIFELKIFTKEIKFSEKFESKRVSAQIFARKHMKNRTGLIKQAAAQRAKQPDIDELIKFEYAKPEYRASRQGDASK